LLPGRLGAAALLAARATELTLLLSGVSGLGSARALLSHSSVLLSRLAHSSVLLSRLARPATLLALTGGTLGLLSVPLGGLSTLLSGLLGSLATVLSGLSTLGFLLTASSCSLLASPS